ncbi:MAG: permease-like cell division protein FtsX [Candidatus Taylorbacteria bacterium]|nr:permease-like cell division protein FtsX [Candidatus Taylorbacteria bacterium]
MIFTNFKRIIRTGFINFWRNGFLSFSAVIVITLSLSVFGALIFGSAFSRALIKEVKNKVDINVYFTLGAQESDIFALRKTIEALPEVDKVEYISRDQALTDFKNKWKDNALILQGLEEIGSNPFPAVLNIKAKEPSQYAGIASFLDGKSNQNGSNIIEKINYNQNKLIIDRLGRIIPAVEKSGSIIAILFVFVAVIIVFNTVRLIIFTARDEISVMKLVGASNLYIRGPFVISGIMYGIFSGILTLIILGAFAFYSDALIMKFAGIQSVNDFSLLSNVFSSYFIQNFGQIFAIIMGSGMILGGISSYLSVKRYLRV